MTEQEVDVLTRRVLLGALELEWAERIERGRPFETSARFQREMRSMLKDPLRWASRKAQPVWKTVLQRAAVVLLVFFLSLGSAVAVSPAVREAVVRWVVELYETHIIYRYRGEDISGKMPQYEIQALPEGYVESEREEGQAHVDITYDNAENGESIFMSYVYMQQGCLLDIATENLTEIKVTINGMEGYLYPANDIEHDMSTVIWIDPNENLQFVVDAVLSESELLQMVRSIYW